MLRIYFNTVTVSYLSSFLGHMVKHKYFAL